LHACIGLDLTIPHIEVTIGKEEDKSAKMLRTGTLIALRDYYFQQPVFRSLFYESGLRKSQKK
jgi:hypothetical protein